MNNIKSIQHLILFIGLFFQIIRISRIVVDLSQLFTESLYLIHLYYIKFTKFKYMS